MCFEKALDSFCDPIIMEKLAVSPTNADTIVSLLDPCNAITKLQNSLYKIG